MAPSSTSSSSDRVYSFEQLLQFGSTTNSSSSSASSIHQHSPMGPLSISPAVLSSIKAQFPDMMPEDEDETHPESADAVVAAAAAAATRPTAGLAHSLDYGDDIEFSDEEYDDEYEDDGRFVYGDVVIRSELDEKLVARLRRAVHDALSSPRAYLPSPTATTTTSSFGSSISNSSGNAKVFTKASDGPWRNTSHSKTYSPPHHSTRYPNATTTTTTNNTFSYHDRQNYGVNLFKEANALHFSSHASAFTPKSGADRENWRSRESRATSWRNTNVKWNDSTRSYVPLPVA